MDERKHGKDSGEAARETARTEKLLELLRSVRAPEPPPGYLAAFWPRLREKLPSRRTAILQPLHYGGLAAAAAALVLWVTLSGPGPEIAEPGPAFYALATASLPAEAGGPAVNYVSGHPRAAEVRPVEMNYVLPRIEARDNGRLEV